MDGRYGVGDYVRVVREFSILGRPEGEYLVASITPEEYEGKQILRVSLDDGTGERRSFFYEDCEPTRKGEGR
jgi:hypothetical protein